VKTAWQTVYNMMLDNSATTNRDEHFRNSATAIQHVV